MKMMIQQRPISFPKHHITYYYINKIDIELVMNTICCYRALNCFSLMTYKPTSLTIYDRLKIPLKFLKFQFTLCYIYVTLFTFNLDVLPKFQSRQLHFTCLKLLHFYLGKKKNSFHLPVKNCSVFQVQHACYVPPKK